MVLFHMLLLNFIILECCLTDIALKTNVMNSRFMLPHFVFGLQPRAANVTPKTKSIGVVNFDMSLEISGDSGTVGTERTLICGCGGG